MASPTEKRVIELEKLVKTLLQQLNRSMDRERQLREKVEAREKQITHLEDEIRRLKNNK